MLAYQCAFVSLNFGVVENWKRISNILMFPKMLDQCGFPKGSTVSLDEGTVHVTESFFFATSKYPPPSVVTSHQALICRQHDMQIITNNINDKGRKCIFKLYPLWSHVKLLHVIEISSL